MSTLIASVEVPHFQNYFIISRRIAAKYYKWKDKDKIPKKHDKLKPFNRKKFGKHYFVIDRQGNRIVKNVRSAGKQRLWNVNGQDLYNGRLHPVTRAKITKWFHHYLGQYITQQISQGDIELISRYKGNIRITLNIHEVKRKNLPDVSNLWLWIKWFEDALQEREVILDDNPDWIRSSGGTTYHWVETEEDRKLKFNIEIVQ